MYIRDWNIKELTGYEPITSFYRDFSIADRFGVSAIKDTFNRAFREWKTSYKYLTELVMALNWKIWEHHENNNQTFSLLYDELWRKAQNYALENLKDDELDYFYTTTD